MSEKKKDKRISIRVPEDKYDLLKKELKECRDYILQFPEDHEIILFHLPKNTIEETLKDLNEYLTSRGHDISIYPDS